MRANKERPAALKVRNLMARKVSEYYQILRWDNDQYDQLCGYRVAVAGAKMDPTCGRQNGQPARSHPIRSIIIWLSTCRAYSIIPDS